MGNRTPAIRIAAAFLTGMLLTLLCTPCAASGEDRTVRVAYFSAGDYYQLQADGTVDSYDRAFLNKISEYSGLRFTYVDCGTWKEALQMLRGHQVDLVGTMQQSEKRRQTYAMCETSYGYTAAELVALPDSGYVYEDYDAIGKATIGYVSNYIRLPELQTLLKEHGLMPQLKSYPGQEELIQALQDGKIDLIASNSHAVLDSWTVVEKYCYSDCFFASWKGNEELTGKIDEAIRKINLYDDRFDDETLREYFPKLMEEPLTKAERDLIAQNRVYIVYCDGEADPISWYDQSSGTMRGALPDICKELEKSTGLRFQFRPYQEWDGKGSECTAVSEAVPLSGDIRRNASQGKTDSFLNSDFLLYYKVGKIKTANRKKSYRIAIPGNRGAVWTYLAKNYPKSTIREYETPAECLRAVENGDADMTFLNSYVAEHILIREDIGNIASLPSETCAFALSLRFYGQEKAMLASIVNKSVHMIGEQNRSQILLKYALGTTPKVTFRYILKNNIKVVLVFSLIAIAGMLVAAAFAASNRAMRRQEARVRAAVAAKEEFYSRMSHDMRTPMNGILGVAELMKGETDPRRLRRDLNKITEAGGYMLSLINDTLDMQRAETGKITIEPRSVNCGDFVESLSAMIQPTAEEKNIRFSVTREKTDCCVRMDPVRTKQIFVNLLSNAVKYTPEGGRVEWIIRLLSKDENVCRCEFEIRDTGVGMSPEFLKDGIFRPFAQEHNEMSDRYAGSGLGLSIAKKLTELMGGSISVRSELGVGSVFTVRLNFERIKGNAPALPADTETDRGGESLRGRRVLLCEDHPLNAEIVIRLLRKAGCETDWAQNGREGVDRFAGSTQNDYDAILMDIRMPEIDGLEATRAIRALNRPDAVTIPIIAMSANAFESDVRKSLEAGMNGHLPKPVDPERLFAVLSGEIAAAEAEKRSGGTRR